MIFLHFKRFLRAGFYARRIFAFAAGHIIRRQLKVAQNSLVVRMDAVTAVRHAVRAFITNFQINK
jgi:hypothetical protein